MKKFEIFFSFHFDKDFHRSLPIRRLEIVEENEHLNPDEWSILINKGIRSIETWHNVQFKNKVCLIVLIGEETFKRPLVIFEIMKAYSEKMPILGIYIHDIPCLQQTNSLKGANPFDELTVDGSKLSKYITCFEPSPTNPIDDIKMQLPQLIKQSILDILKRP